MCNTRTASYHNVRSDDAKLMDRAHTADDHVVIHDNVAAKRGIVCKNAIVADHAIVGNVSIDHQQVVVSDFGDTAPLDRAAMYRDALPDSIAIAHLYNRRLSGVFQD